MEFLLSEFLYFYLFALMLVCFISDLGFVPAAFSKFLFMKKKTKKQTTTGRVGVYKQIVGLYVIDN